MMTPSRHSVLVLLGIAASIQAVPAPLPEPDVLAPRQITLNPPSYSISWDPPLPPQPTQDPEDPEDPGYPPVPQPSDQISLSPPSYSISWDGPQVPTETPAPEDPEPEDPEDPEPQPPKPSDQISLSPPSYSISWDGPAVPTPSTTKKPGWPHWTPKPKPTTSSKPKISMSVSWNKRQEDEPEPTDIPDPEFPEDPVPDPEDPEDPGDGGPIVIPPLFPTPGNSIGIQPPKVSFSWGKRDVVEAEATPPPSIGLGNPTYSFWWPKPPKHTSGYISWGKRQDEEEPTETIPDPTEILPPIFPQPSDQISMNTPTASVSWGKRDNADAEYPPPTWWLGNPTASIWWPKPPKQTGGYISWGKRQDDEEPTEVVAPAPTPSDEISMLPPEASISWGKRDGADYPPPTWWLGNPTASIWWPKPPKHTSGYISWGKRDEAAAEATPPPSIGLGNPAYSFWWPKPPKSSAYVSWGKREAEAEAQVDTVGLIWPTNIPKPTWDLPLPPLFTPPTYVSWGKRDAEPEPTAPAELPEGEKPESSCGITTTVSKVKPCPQITCGSPCKRTPGDFEVVPEDVAIAGEPSYNPILDCPLTKTATNKCPTCVCPTTLVSVKPTLTPPPTKPTPSACPTVTKTIVPPCIPPVCPQSLTPCKSVEVIDSTGELEEEKDNVKVREIEKTIVTIKTVKPSRTPTATVIDKCTPIPTITVNVGCPTYTCVPYCPASLKV